MNSYTKLPFKNAAKQVLSKAGEPLHYRDITKRALDQELIATGGKTPAATMNSQIAVDLLRRGPSSLFVRVQPGVFCLRKWLDDSTLTEL